MVQNVQDKYNLDDASDVWVMTKYAVLLDFVFVMLQTLHMAEVVRIVLHPLALFILIVYYYKL